MTWAVHEGNVAPEEHLCTTIGILAESLVLLLGSIRLVALGIRTPRALVELGISITQFNGDVTNLFFLVTDGLVGLKKKQVRYGLHSRN